MVKIFYWNKKVNFGSIIILYFTELILKMLPPPKKNLHLGKRSVVFLIISINSKIVNVRNSYCFCPFSF